MKQAYGYVRVSSERQEQEGFSIPAQKKLIEEYARRHQIELVNIFEETQSAKAAGRTEFNELANKLLDGDVKTVLVEKTDRLYRNMKDYTALDFEHLNLEIHFVKENIVLSKNSKSNEKFVHGIKVLMAKNYSDNLSEEVKKGSKEKAEQGWYPSPAPLGYLNQDKVIKVDPKTGHMVSKTFELASTGQYSLSRLSTAAFEIGLKSKRANKKLSKSAMQRLIQNCFYYGSFIYGGGVQYNNAKHKPLVSYELYRKANEQMGLKLKPKDKSLFFAFGNLMLCHHCGCAITAEQKIKKSGKRYVYYHCTDAKNTCENPFYLNETKVEKIISEALDKIKLSTEIIDWTKTAIEKTYDEERDYRLKEIGRLQARYNQIESFQDKMYEDKLEDRISETLWRDKHNRYQSEQTKILDQLKHLEVASDAFKEDSLRLLELANKASKLFKLGTPEEKRKIAGMILSNPVFKDGSIEYNYGKPFDDFVNVVDLVKWRELPTFGNYPKSLRIELAYASIRFRPNLA